MEKNIIWYTISMFNKKRTRRSREFRKSSNLIDFEKAKKAREEKREAQAKNAKAQEKEELSKRKKDKRNKKRSLYTAIIVIIIAVAIVSIYNVISVHGHLEEAVADKERLETEKSNLEDTLQNVDSPDYIEQQARTMLKMIRPGEIYYVVPTGDDE